MSASIATDCSGGSPTNCEEGETINMGATYTDECSSDTDIYFQIDAKSTDGICDIQYSDGDMSGLTQQEPIVISTPPSCYGQHIDNGDGTCTAILKNPTVDGEIVYHHRASKYYALYEDNDFARYGYVWERGDDYYDRASIYIEWDIITIPDNANIVDLKFKYHGGRYETGGVVVGILNIQPSTVVTEEERKVLDFDIVGGEEYINPHILPQFIEMGRDKEVSLDSTARRDLNKQLESDWFAIGIRKFEQYSYELLESEIVTEEAGGKASPKPTLEVTYIPVGTISGTWTIPPVATDCEGKIIYAHAASLWNGEPGGGTQIASISDVNPEDPSPVDGSFTFTTPLGETTTTTTTTTVPEGTPTALVITTTTIPVTTTVGPAVYSFNLKISGGNLFTIGEGQQVTMYIENTGNIQDSYRVTCEKQATYETLPVSHLVDLSPDAGTIDFVNPGATGDMTITVTLLGQITEGSVTCNAQSVGSPGTAEVSLEDNILTIIVGYPLSVPEFGLLGFIELVILASATLVISYTFRFR